MHIGTYIVHSTYAHPKFTQKSLFRCISLRLKTKIQMPNFYFLLQFIREQAVSRGFSTTTKIKTRKNCILYLVFSHRKMQRSKHRNENRILLPKLFWITVRKNCSSDGENFWNLRLKAENLQNFEITRTIFGNRMLF